MRSKFLLPAAVFAAAALGLTGCVNNEPAAPTGAASASAPAVSKNTDLAALVPAKVKAAGKLVIGTDPSYAPNEYKDASGKPIGWDIELAQALAAELGLGTEFQAAKFDNILPSIVGGKYDLGVSSFTDNAEREKQVDFVDYYTAGIAWAQPKGKNVDPNNACGLRVAVQATTVEDTEEIPAKSKACTDAGKKAIQKLKYDGQDQATNALVLGQVDALSADSPVTAYAIKQTGGKLEPAGEVFDTTPYGMPLAKGSDLTPAIQKGLQALVDNGTYGKILAKWGVEGGAVKEITLNGAAKG